MSALTPIYWLLGAYFARIAWRAWHGAAPRPRTRTAFYATLSVLFAFGDWMPAQLDGALVLLVAAIAGFGLPESTSSQSAQAADRGRSQLLWPILLIPALTVALTLLIPKLALSWLSGANVAVVALVVACGTALPLALAITRERAMHAIDAGGDLFEAIGWAAMLPLLLAVLGSVFAAAGVGDALATLLGAWLPLDVRWVAVIAYGLGMALLTMLMGNAFAAFPVIAGGIGLPFLVNVHGADPAPLAAIGMLSGYCGTLLTPMAANFNLVPVALLDLKDRYAVIRAQVPTALPLLAGNLILIGVLCFR